MEEISRELFEAVDSKDQKSDEIVRPNITYWQDAWRRLKKNPIAMTALVFLVLTFILVIVGPYISGQEAVKIIPKEKNIDPNSKYWFGTDALGRDLFSRVWIGARVSIIIGIFATFIQVIVGSLYGGVMAYCGGYVDEIMMRIIEVLTSIPHLLVTILLSVVLGNGIKALLIALSITAWCGTARMMRGQLMQLRESEYVLAAQALGASPERVIIKHLIPNTIGILILNIATSIPSYIFAEASLSFIGLGIQAPGTSLGVLIATGQDVMEYYPYQLMCPAGILVLIVLAFNLFGEGLRDALDPKLRQ